MVDGPEDIDGGDGGSADEGPILAPEELDITDDEHVTEIDEGRFVVSPDATQGESPTGPGTDASEGRSGRRSDTVGPDHGDATQRSGPSGPDGPGAATGGGQGEPTLDREEVHRWLRESFAGGASAYGFDVTATFDGSVSQRRMASNDVVTIFEQLILWYAQQIDTDTPVEEILGILLMEANMPVRYPPESLKRLVRSAGLSPDDTVADLLAAVDEDDGVEL